MAEVNKTNLRLITRLIESGITSEKQIMALKLKDILSASCRTRSNRSASWLSWQNPKPRKEKRKPKARRV